jgi:hypothetical protein
LATVRAINSRNPHTALLAIQLLKTLVKECGYPFHLQIATKEFLNELVRRFPERPPMVLGPVMGKILEVGTLVRLVAHRLTYDLDAAHPRMEEHHLRHLEIQG